jgi:hypothetical protein
MVVVVFIWVQSLGDKFTNQTAEKKEDGLKPFTLFANSISNTYSDIAASVGSVSIKNKTEITDTKPQQINLTPVEPAQ